MKIIDRYKRKIHFKDTKFDLVYSIDNEVLKKYERNKGLLGIRYIPFLCIDYINKYFRSEEKKNSNISHCDYYDEREVPNDKLKELIDKKVMDKGYNIKLSPVIRIGESGDFYVYAKARYYIGNNECKIKNIKIDNKEYNAFRVLTLKSWEQIREKIKDKCDLINIIVCQPKTIE